ncbi:MAG: 5-oxoprolinase subunit PxpB [Rhodomicrobium sp.]
MRLSFTFFDCAESALLVDFGVRYSKSLSLEILTISEGLAKRELPGMKESIPALSSLTVFYDPLLLSRERLTAEIEAVCSAEQTTALRSRTWELPVIYGGESGPDLEDVASRAGLTASEAASLHAGELYQVYMLGFLPGFAYLGDLPEPLRLPRRSTPRTRVPAGSVAIAAEMTAVYPLESPGGWHLIGYTPIVLWDIARQDEPLLKPGDGVRFVEVDSLEAEELRNRSAAGWRPEPAGRE